MALLLDSDEVCSEIWRGGVREAERGLERWLVELRVRQAAEMQGPYLTSTEGFAVSTTSSPVWLQLAFEATL